jgi:hypothetical protein
MNDVGRPHGYLSGPCNGAAQNYNGAYRSHAATGVGVVRLNGNVTGIKNADGSTTGINGQRLSAMATAQTAMTLAVVLSDTRPSAATFSEAIAPVAASSQQDILAQDISMMPAAFTRER